MTTTATRYQHSSSPLQEAEPIRQARTSADLAAIRRLRYRVYIEEQLKLLPWADHTARELSDSLDETATHFIAERNNEARAAARLHFREDVPPDLLKNMGLGELLEEISGQFGLFSKLVVERSHRGHWLAAAAMRAGYREGRRRGGTFCLCHCVPRLVPYYERIGLHRTGKPFDDGYVGLQVPMVVIVEEQHHFDARRSFFARTAQEYENVALRASKLNIYFKSRLKK